MQLGAVYLHTSVYTDLLMNMFVIFVCKWKVSTSSKTKQKKSPILSMI